MGYTLERFAIHHGASLNSKESRSNRSQAASQSPKEYFKIHCQLLNGLRKISRVEIRVCSFNVIFLGYSASDGIFVQIFINVTTKHHNHT